MNKNNKKNKNTFISEKKYNIISIFIKYVTYNSFLETAIMVGYCRLTRRLLKFIIVSFLKKIIDSSFINHFVP